MAETTTPDNKVANNHSEEVEQPCKLPRQVARRLNALKNLQIKMIDVESKFYEEIHQLESKYAALFDPLYEQREKIVSGEYEPTDEEAKLEFGDDADDDEEEDNLTKDVKRKLDLNDTWNDTDYVGIPGFWLQAFRRTDIISDMIQEHDVAVLQFLKDIRVKMQSTKPYGYTLEFHFNQNEFFTNKVLTKTYELTCDKDEKDPFAYDGPIMYRSKGCAIEWAKGKDVTVRQVKKKQKNKTTGVIREIVKEEKQDSFFNFFEAPTFDGYRPSMRAQFANAEEREKLAVMGDDDSEDEDLCEADFEIGHFFKEFLVPKAVLYYTGDLIDDSSYEDYEEEEEGDEGEMEEGQSEADEQNEEEIEEVDGDNDDGQTKNNKKQSSKKSKSKPTH